MSYSAYSPSRRLDLMRVHATLRDVNNCSLRGSTSDPGSTRDPGSNRDPVLLLYKDGNTIDCILLLNFKTVRLDSYLETRSTFYLAFRLDCENF